MATPTLNYSFFSLMLGIHIEFLREAALRAFYFKEIVFAFILTTHKRRNK